MANQSTPCTCGGKPTLIFACSGGSDVGGLADHTARAMGHEGTGRMYCLAGLGGGVTGITETTRSADRILAIDGCPINCAARTLERAGFSGFAHLCLADIGFRKGSSPATAENVEKVRAAAAWRLNPSETACN